MKENNKSNKNAAPTNSSKAKENTKVPAKHENTSKKPAARSNVNKFNITIDDNLVEECAAEMSSKNNVKTPKTQKSGRKSSSYHAVITIVKALSIICISALLSLFILISLSDVFGMAKGDKVVDITVSKNASNDEIADMLQKDGVIRSSFIFKMYLNFKKDKLNYGSYTLNSNMGYKDIIEEMSPNKKARTVVKITIPEGYTIQKIAELLDKKKVCSAEDFITAVNNKSVKFDFASQVPDKADRYYRLEGYMFPDTYQFYVNQSADSVVNKILSNFDNRLNKEFRNKINSSGMSVDQVITLASIIQTEASNVPEMPKVSSVFHNRLEKGINGGHLLQSDATIFYVKRNNITVLTAADIELNSPYNTYKYQGLTPGAICNPGLEAIDAALSPAKTKYFYFVTDKDSNYYYAETYPQHLANVKKAVKSGKVGGTTVTS